MTKKFPANTNIVIGPNGFPNYKPLNPWGRVMPKAKRIKSREPTPLYQVMVETDDGTQLPVGPKLDQVTAGRCCEAISKTLIHAKGSTWHNPTVVMVQPT